MKNIKMTLSVSIIALTLGCAKKVETKKTETKPGSEIVSLGNKSFTEIMELKYNKAELICRMYIQVGPTLDITKEPNAQVALDLKAPYTLPLELSMGSNILNHSLTAKIEVKEFGIQNVTIHQMDEQLIFELENSPFARVNFSATSKTTTESGTMGSSHSGSDTKVNEAEKSRQLESHLITSNFIDYVNCSIEGDIKPEYKDQLKIESSKK